MRGKVIIVDDDPSTCDLLEKSLKRRGFEVVSKNSAAEAFDVIGAGDLEAVITDLNMKGMNGLELCEKISANFPEVPVTVITGFGSLETAIAAIRAGAYDFITKPFEIDAVAMSLDRAIQYRRLRTEVKRLQQAVVDSQGFQDLLGESPPMKTLYDLISRSAESEASVLIAGETGTGKELVARGLHQRSRRQKGPFVAVNCAAVPEQLLESELFGHVRGAFTDAKTPRTGLLVMAGGGTLFLDEVGDMPLSLQPKLLRVLQERCVRPVGSDAEIPVDVRIVAATRMDLEACVAEGRFREDLFFRLNVIPIDVPPLRSRGNDVLLLAQKFIDHFAARSQKKVMGLSPEAAGKLIDYSWPGNVRELQNCIERAVVLTRYESLTVEDLPLKIRNYTRAQLPLVGDHPEDLVPMEEVEKRYILRVLEGVSWNKTLAAQTLGFDRKTLYRKIERYRLEPESGTAPGKE